MVVLLIVTKELMTSVVALDRHIYTYILDRTVARTAYIQRARERNAEPARRVAIRHAEGRTVRERRSHYITTFWHS